MSRKQANLLAFASFVLALILAGVFVAEGDSLDATKTTVTTTPETPEVPGTTKTTTVTKEVNGEQTEETVTTEESSGTPSKPETVQTVEETAAPTSVERALGDGGTDVLRIGVVLLAAFLIAAIIQRVALGHYQIKIGSLELAAIADDAATAAAAVEKKLTTELEAQQAEFRKADLAMNRRLIAAVKQLKKLEQDVERLKSKRR